MPNMATVDFGPFARERGVRLLLQFGSTVTGRVHEGSDVDLAVMLDRPPASLSEYGALAADLQRFFPDREVDVAVLNHADPLLLKQVVDSCRLLHGASRALSELRIYAFKRYRDHQRFLAMERDYVRRKVGAAP